MNLVHLRLRRGEATAEARPVDGSGILYFCAKDLCPHYQGQLALLTGAEAMLCALVQHPPDRICQPFYLEVAEDLDRTAASPGNNAWPKPRPSNPPSPPPPEAHHDHAFPPASVLVRAGPCRSVSVRAPSAPHTDPANPIAARRPAPQAL